MKKLFLAFLGTFLTTVQAAENVSPETGKVPQTKQFKKPPDGGKQEQQEQNEEKVSNQKSIYFFKPWGRSQSQLLTEVESASLETDRKGQLITKKARILKDITDENIKRSLMLQGQLKYSGRLLRKSKNS